MNRKAALWSLVIFGVALFGIGARLRQPPASGFTTKGKFGGTLQRTSLSPTSWSIKVNGVAEIAGVGSGKMEIVHENVGLVEGDTPNLAPSLPIGTVTKTALLAAQRRKPWRLRLGGPCALCEGCALRCKGKPRLFGEHGHALTLLPTIRTLRLRSPG